MCVGPIVGGVGLLMLTGVGADPDYVTEVLPGVIVFGLGLSATVAPLTATALNSVEERHVGIASGINNGVARVAGLLAVAVLGALIAGHFGSSVDEKVTGTNLSSDAERVITEAKTNPLQRPDTSGLPPADADRVETATVSAAEDSFHLAMMVAGILMIAGGTIAGIGLRNPKRVEEHHAPRAAPAGECVRVPPRPQPVGIEESAELA
jgi:hypothetical protein